ncbi:MAG: hypothetical protein VX699_02830 [Myxococcota bacterium]|nr:hypothetical protein [Myxococcota bacterium]
MSRGNHGVLQGTGELFAGAGDDDAALGADVVVGQSSQGRDRHQVSASATPPPSGRT